MNETTQKVLILCRRDDREEYDRRVTMLRGLATVHSNAEYVGADYEDLLFSFDGRQLTVTDTVSGTDIADYDAIFLIGWFKTKRLDDVARAVAHYAYAHSVPFVNSEAYYGRSFTKLSQCVIAALNGITVTPFLFSLDQQILLEEVQKRDVATPYIAKAIAASRGKDNYLITAHDELAKVIAEPSDTPLCFIVQEFVPNDGDYRILVMGGKVRLVIHRQAQEGSHLNNTSQGGKATLVDTTELPQDVLDSAVKVAELFKRELTGVDMIRHRENGSFYFLEANNMPQLSTGSFVTQKLEMLSEYMNELAEGSATRYID